MTINGEVETITNRLEQVKRVVNGALNYRKLARDIEAGRRTTIDTVNVHANLALDLDKDEDLRRALVAHCDRYASDLEQAARDLLAETQEELRP